MSISYRLIPPDLPTDRRAPGFQQQQQGFTITDEAKEKNSTSFFIPGIICFKTLRHIFKLGAMEIIPMEIIQWRLPEMENIRNGDFLNIAPFVWAAALSTLPARGEQSVMSKSAPLP